MNSDVFVHSGHWEGMPTTLIEAASVKLPIISTNAGHSSIFLKNGEYGLIYDPGDIHELANNIINVVLNYQNAMHKANLLYESVINSYTFNSVSKKIDKIYDYL